MTPLRWEERLNLEHYFFQHENSLHASWLFFPVDLTKHHFSLNWWLPKKMPFISLKNGAFSWLRGGGAVAPQLPSLMFLSAYRFLYTWPVDLFQVPYNGKVLLRALSPECWKKQQPPNPPTNFKMLMLLESWTFKLKNVCISAAHRCQRMSPQFWNTMPFCFLVVS